MGRSGLVLLYNMLLCQCVFKAWSRSCKDLIRSHQRGRDSTQDAVRDHSYYGIRQEAVDWFIENSGHYVPAKRRQSRPPMISIKLYNVFARVQANLIHTHSQPDGTTVPRPALLGPFESEKAPNVWDGIASYLFLL